MRLCSLPGNTSFSWPSPPSVSPPPLLFSPPAKQKQFVIHLDWTLQPWKKRGCVERWRERKLFVSFYYKKKIEHKWKKLFLSHVQRKQEIICHFFFSPLSALSALSLSLSWMLSGKEEREKKNLSDESGEEGENWEGECGDISFELFFWAAVLPSPIPKKGLKHHSNCVFSFSCFGSGQGVWIWLCHTNR